MQKGRKKSKFSLFLRIITGILLIIAVAGVKHYPEKIPENFKKTVYYTAKHNFNISEFKETLKDVGIFYD